ncbi:T9SS type A sorting domain-containing protein [Flavobacterium sp. DGU38]|uniref:T9SS type A sorting domain-containing protein n=1 Tax=Flavobacterium calami TaxID=3139144 RepID=A0ABU9IPY6_9FLAO
MKPKFLFFLLFLVNAGAYAQYTAIPDPKFEAKLIALKLDDAADGKVLTSNINTVKSLSISFSSIKDLTGLQDFTALTSLNVGANELTTLDVSKNTALISLFCYNNQLTTLNISNNTALANLQCYNNFLTSLDVSKNTALTTLQCHYNKINSLNISNNSKLTAFYCNDNLLTSINLKNGKNTTLGILNLRNNPFLTCISVDDVAYANTKWANQKDDSTVFVTYDCAATTSISNPLFEDKLIALGIDTDGKNGLVLNSSIETITTLDVSNSSLTDLTGIEGFKGLTTLNVSNNSLKSIDLSKNTALTSLNCSNNATLTCIQVANIATAKANITTSQEAKDKFNLDCKAYTLIPDAKFEEKLISLGLDDVADGRVLTSKINKIKDLNLRSSGIVDFTGIQDFTNLTTLNCSYNHYATTLDVSNNLNLKNLYCTDNDVKTIKLSSSLVNLELDRNELTSLDVSKNTDLTNLSFVSNAVSSIDVSNSTKLNNLAFSNNNISDLDITKNTELTTLECGNNKIKNLNISKNTKLIFLNCAYNQITSLNTTENKDLQTLVCANNEIANLDVSKNEKLTGLNASGNKLTSLDVSKNTSLQTLAFSSNQIENIDINNATKITSLSVSKNNLSNLSTGNLPELNYLYCDNNKITSLDVSKNTKLLQLDCSSNQLTYLNIKNKTSNFKSFKCLINPNLTCIAVDDVTTANTTWINSKDTNAIFSIYDCLTLTQIPSELFENKLIALGIDTDGKNGIVLNSSIANITTLDVSNSSLTDLIGLEGFKSLTSLNCSNNLFDNIDISKNPTLNNLNCDNNTLLRCILVADIEVAKKTVTTSQQTKDKFSLDCTIYTIIPDAKFEAKLIALGYDTELNGKIPTININELKTLNIGYSEITDLTGIQDFEALTTLSCYNNKLTTLDLSKNPNIVKLECSFNKITNLNISNNTNLSELACTSNNLTRLDLSKNKALTRLSCSNNNLTQLNIKNGNNTNLSYLSIYSNPLFCITVDDVVYANTKWKSLLGQNAMFTTYDCTSVTVIPDTKFEDKLIALGIDTDGKNGIVNNSSIEKLTSLDVSNSSITNLTGLHGFKALSTLNCYNNVLKTLDLDQNPTLVNLNCSTNQLTDLVLEKCIALKELDLSSNQFTRLELDKNVALTKLNCNSNKLYYVNLQNNKALTSLSCNTNEFTSLSLGGNQLQYLDCSVNKLSSLYLEGFTELQSLICSDNKIFNLRISENTKLKTVTANNNQVTNVDLSKLTLLESLNVSTNKLTQLDVSKNTALKQLFGSSNLLTSINISSNKSLTDLDCSSNKLTVLNLKNGNNTKFNSAAINFKNNPDLSCIKVDNESYSNTNWAAKKDNTASYSLFCDLNIPANNFSVETRSESCVNQKNGGINISGKASYPYVANINGQTKAFTDNSLNLENLAPGNYSVVITIPDENFEQKYNFTIEKASTISGKSSVSSKEVNVEITEGTAPYTVFVDGIEQFETQETNFSITAKKGRLLEVKTAKACEGVYAKDISELDIMVSAYPNPTSGQFYINVPTSKEEIIIQINTLDGRVVSNKKYILDNGIAKLTLENEPQGVYFATVYLDTIKTVKIIKK